MKKYVFATALTFLILFSASAFALEINVRPAVLKVRSEELANFVLLIENDQNYADEFSITIDGPNLAWIQNTLPQLKLQPTQGEMINITFFPSGREKGEFEYVVNVESIRYHEVIESEDFTLVVLHPLNIVSFTSQKVNGQLEMIMDLEALGRQSASLSFQIKDKDGMIVYDLFEDIEVIVSKRITKYIDVSDLLAGDYKIVVRIVGTDLYKEADFTVEPVRKIIQVRTVDSNPLFKIIEVTIENHGNVIENDYEYYQDIESDAFTGFVTKPDNCFDEDGGMKCRYTIGEIAPGMTAKIIYRVDLWPILGGYALGLMGIVSGAGIVFKRTTRPKIKKKSIRKSGSEHTIFLELKNPFRKDIENIVVRDWVSPLAIVVNKFDSVKPVIRRSDAGTELIWKLDKIERKDERILSYKIRTMINGEIKMPRAYIRYKNKKGEKGKVFSNPLLVK